MPLDIVIFGSCVSRDAVGLDPERVVPAHYTARQSWVSAASPSAWAPPIDRLTSPFQRRMLRDDFRSSLFSQISEHAPSADLVLFDIVDERLGVIEYFPRRFVTLSAELSSSGYLTGDRLLRRRRLHLGDAEHLRRFRAAAEQVKGALVEADAWHKTLLIRAPYADRSVEGDSLVGDYGIAPEAWDIRYAAYYDLLDDLGFPMIAPPEELLFSTRTHRWGPHPIHYQEPASRALVDRMVAHHDSMG